LRRLSLIPAITILLSAVAQPQNATGAASLTSNPVYQSNCSKCHGKTAEGRFMAGPSLISEKTTALSAEDLRTIITNGRHRMPKFQGKFSAPDIDALLDQIKSSKKQK